MMPSIDHPHQPCGSSSPTSPISVSAQEASMPVRNRSDPSDEDGVLDRCESEPATQQRLSCANRRHLYRGHRSGSLIVEDLDELTEWRARQRTFDGAYLRSALGCSFFALTITKMFRKELSQIGLEFAALSLLILSISYIRRRRLNHDFADAHFPQPTELALNEAQGPRVWGREYRTPGDFVLLMAAAVAAIQIGLIILLANMD
ncbi:hypothetical protein PGT21_018330 [Puccinia graminis f. sp. tritici]|uniref:DUF202 domain-containing protein n=2 Tax=Puccinia graminis f. sp. tritici TaxID=56615 RepID=E3L3E4_PUCGT|nr:uncharacterized protein PGTG_16931 [Puccinia graminis f. sp. tritici CRL 75-36-700-3]EFP91069.2 hypothetical protein PGTG_16931 [Puccinia graminis f. sp. tritici CRL 75-36-700-3]KAA1071749.1 hypothetical protein PGT21_018330 [Puccinia graminis f. sp. tritici]KAA1125910.1 hypothetical protein PGTUg99_018891 [Puccinia graminis f. sp. tritici]